MANSKRGEFEVNFQGEALKLRLGINQICELEEKRGGESIFSLLAKIGGNKGGVRDMRDLAWALLRSQKPDCTDQDAGELLGEIMEDPELFARMQTTIENSLPEEEESTPGKRKPKKNPGRPNG